MRGDRHTYIRAFDGLRGGAVLPVVLLHVGVEVLPNNGLLHGADRNGKVLTEKIIVSVKGARTFTLI